MRQFNDRVLLQAIRRHGPQPQSALATSTRLSVQTVALIIARLEAEGLLMRLKPVRGRVGQPSVPIALNPDGAFSIGVVIGRRRMEALLMDHVGSVREQTSYDYDFPDPDQLFDEIDARIHGLRKALKPALRKRLYGLGIAAPLSLGGWQELLHYAPGLAEKWHGTDFRQRLATLTAARDLDFEFVKDTAAGCVAELVAGQGQHLSSFLYVFVNTFIGGALVLGGHLYPGQTGNAGAIGSLSLGQNARGSATWNQLLSVASLWNLDESYAAADLETGAWADERSLMGGWRTYTLRWLGHASTAIAAAIESAACLLDLPHVVIDGSLGRPLLDALIERLDSALDQRCWEGVARPVVVRGMVGPGARTLGAAMLPLYSNLALDRDIFMKPLG